MSGTEDTKQTGNTSSQRWEWDLRQTSSMFAIRHQWDGLGSPALNLLQRENKITACLSWRRPDTPSRHARKESSVPKHPSPKWKQQEMSTHVSASCTAERASTRTRPRASGLDAQASQGSKSPTMSPIKQRANEQHWWLTWFPDVQSHRPPSTATHERVWNRHQILFPLPDSAAKA